MGQSQKSENEDPKKAVVAGCRSAHLRDAFMSICEFLDISEKVAAVQPCGITEGFTGNFYTILPRKGKNTGKHVKIKASHPHRHLKKLWEHCIWHIQAHIGSCRETITPCVFKECRVLLRILSEAGDSAVINWDRITVIPLTVFRVEIYAVCADLSCDPQCFLITVFFAVRPVKGLLSFYSYVSPVFYKFVLYFTRNGRHCQTP